jgi:hypothetical protein
MNRKAKLLGIDAPRPSRVLMVDRPLESMSEADLLHRELMLIAADAGSFRARPPATVRTAASAGWIHSATEIEQIRIETVVLDGREIR